ncbi:hypothetical protein C8Q75DRAFT_729802 [Abortiporus biennis]|nr:hypothetical protein C8Q75DRAFT_729802 [Abortiporus biennis]
MASSSSTFQSTRTFLYVFVHLLSTANIVFSSLTIGLRFGRFFFLDNTGLYSVIVSGVQFIWIAVLLGFNNRPNSEWWFAKTRTHVYSFIFFSLLWIASAILDIRESALLGNASCRSGAFLQQFCIFRATVTALGISLCLLIYVYRTAKSLHLLGGNIAEQSKEQTDV